MLSPPFCQVMLDKTLENSSNVNNELENERKDYRDGGGITVFCNDLLFCNHFEELQTVI